MDYIGVKKFQEGGAVQEALPIKWKENQVAPKDNPYADLSDVLNPQEEVQIPEIDMDQLIKADGLMGERNAVIDEVLKLQNQIKEKTLTDRFWIETHDGIAALSKLQSILYRAPNELKVSKELANAAETRVGTNGSEKEFVTDLTSSNLVAIDNATGQFKEITPFEYNQDRAKGTGKYSLISNSQALQYIHTSKDSPYTGMGSKNGIYLKQITGAVNGETKVMDEIDTQLKQVGSTTEGKKETTFDFLRNTNLASLLVTAGWDPDRLVEETKGTQDSSDAENLKAAIHRLLGTNLGLSAASKMHLRNAAMRKIEGIDFVDKEAFQKALDSEMTKSIYGLIAERAKESHSTSIEGELTDESALDVLGDKGHAYTSGDLKGLIGTQVEPGAYKNGDQLTPIGSSKVSSSLVFEGARIQGKSAGDFGGNVHAIVSRMIPEQALLTMVPVNSKGQVMTEITKEGKDIVDYNKRKGELLEEAKKSMVDDADKYDPNVFKDQLVKLAEEFLIFGNDTTFKPAIVYAGFLPTDDAWIGQDDKKLMTEAGASAVTDKSELEDLYRKTGYNAKSEVDQWFRTKIIVPLNDNYPIKKAITGNLYMKSKEQGGRLNINRSSGKLLTFKDLTNL